MDYRRNSRRLNSCLAVVLALSCAVVAKASDGGKVAASLVQETNYRFLLDDMLYTHAGDNRGYGAEHDLARANIQALMASYGLSVELDPFEYNGETYYNVVGTKLGTTYPDQIYLVGAHYDSVNNPGADDNASGTALILEVARVLSAYPSESTIRLIAFDREEQGLIGSRNYVQEHLTDDIRAAISTDMVAYNTGADVASIECGSGSANLKGHLADAVMSYGDGLGYDLYGMTSGSDHYYFEYYGFEGCLFIEDWGNPFYHSSRDNVDEPDYIDYAYAVKMTRSIVGYLVDHAGVSIDLPDGDYDEDGDVDQADYDVFAACWAGPDVTPPTGCDFFDLDSDNDVDCVDADLFTAVWSGPGEPAEFWPCNPLPPLASSDSCRCLSITPPVHEIPMALLIEGSPTDADVSCVSLYVQADGTLGATPVYQTYDAWGTVMICDQAIVAGASYRISSDFGAATWPSRSIPSTMRVVIIGDTVGSFTGGEWMPPDGGVNIADVTAVIEGFRGLPTAPPFHRIDLVGIGAGGTCMPDGSIDIVDAVASLNGFRGFSHAVVTGCPLPCP